MTLSRRWRVFLVILVFLAAVGAAAAGLIGRHKGPITGTARAADAERPSVPVVHPKRDSSYRVGVRLLATVEAFYQANLRARVAGNVKTVAKAMGEPVRRGELLVEIDAPDLEQDVAQKAATVQQRRQELALAQAMVKDAAAKVEVAKANVLQQKSEVGQATAMADLHKKRLDRFRLLAGSEVVTPAVIDEQVQSAMSTAAAADAARVEVKKADAEQAEKEASLATAQADVKLREQMIAVAQRDLDRALALASYARLTAPFDGVITRRTIDPGSFVQNAATGNSDTLLTVARTDIVTVAFKVPDNAAPFVKPDSPAEIRLDELPGVTIRGRVTRLAEAIEPSDKTMRVEIDLFNDSQAAYCRLLVRSIGCGLAVFEPDGALARTAALAAGGFVAHQDFKGGHGGLPLRPERVGGGEIGRKLLPGMTGYVRLGLDRLSGAYLLPSPAVYTVSGVPYILVVRNGETYQQRVRIQVDDGRLAKVSLVSRTGGHEMLTELTGAEEVLDARQLEIGEGRPVRPVLQDW